MVAESMLPGVDVPIALIGTAEKGYLTIELSVESEPGHASTPPKNTAIGILAKAITRLEDNPLPARMETLVNIFRAAGKHVPFHFRLVFANLWLTKGIVDKMVSGKGETNAIIRTTTAVTVISGGIKDNILPREAKAMVNFRLISGETSDGTVAAARRIINDDRVLVKAVENNGWDPSPVSTVDSPAYAALEKTIHQFFGEAAVAPLPDAGRLGRPPLLQCLRQRLSLHAHPAWRISIEADSRHRRAHQCGRSKKDGPILCLPDAGMGQSRDVILLTGEFPLLQLHIKRLGSFPTIKLQLRPNPLNASLILQPHRKMGEVRRGLMVS